MPVPRLLAVVSALPLLVLGLASCSGDESEDAAQQTPKPSGVLQGSELGLAVGSTTEVPLDVSVAKQGKQTSFSAPVKLLSYDGKGGEEPIVMEITLKAVRPGKISDFNLDADSQALVKDYKVYYVDYKVAYVNGPVATMPNPNWLAPGADGTRVTGDVENFSASSSKCSSPYEVENFGKGAFMERCMFYFVSPGRPEPNEILWTAPAHTDGGLELVRWPVA